jgi:hypothetical protein
MDIYTEYVVWGVKIEDRNKPKYLQESLLQTHHLGETIRSKSVAERIALLCEAKGYTNVRIQSIPFNVGCESDLAKQFTGVK